MKAVLWIRNILGVILFLVSYVLAGAIPYQRLFYKMANPVNQAGSERFTAHGYPAGDRLPRADSIEEIESLEVFTIETNSMTPTGIYCVLDPGDGGWQRGGHRRYPTLWNVPPITDSKIQTYLLQNTYGQFYSVRLRSGESVLVLMDDGIMKTSGSSIKVLPAGTEQLLPSGQYYDGNYLKNYFQTNGSKYGLKNGTSWYVRMAGSEFSKTYQVAAIILHILVTIVFTVCMVLLLNLIFRLLGFTKMEI